MSKNPSSQKQPEAKELAADQWLPLVYRELNLLAARKMAQEAPGHTLQATALVHEAWLRLGGADGLWQNQAHFFAAAAEAMRRILVDRARYKNATRRGGAQMHIDAAEVPLAAPAKEAELLEIHELLDRFAYHHPDKAALVKLRYFVGLTLEEVAGVLGISLPTAKRHWAFARTWLFREITRQNSALAK